MAKEKIDNIVPERVRVTHDPKPQELHQKLGGKEAMPGSPSGREAKPTSVRQGAKGY